MKEAYKRLTIIITAGKYLSTTDGTSSQLDKLDHDVNGSAGIPQAVQIFILLFMSFLVCDEIGFLFSTVQGVSSLVQIRWPQREGCIGRRPQLQEVGRA